MIKAKLTITILVLSAAFGLLNLNQGATSQPGVEINNGLLKAELAATPKERKVGLSKKETLSLDEGMLFVYKNPSYPSIWMKDMNFSIDIIWLNKEKEIVDIETEVSPATYPNSFSPEKSASYVLETKAGFIDKHNIKVGDKLNFEIDEKDSSK